MSCMCSWPWSLCTHCLLLLPPLPLLLPPLLHESCAVVGRTQGFKGEVDFDAEIKAIEKGGRAGQASAGKFRDRGAPPGKGTPAKKRQVKNAKFGECATRCWPAGSCSLVLQGSGVGVVCVWCKVLGGAEACTLDL